MRSGRLLRVRFLARLSPRYGAAIVAGLLLALSFPRVGIAGLAWIAPGFLLFAALGRPGKECFYLGYLAGLVHYLVSLYWLLYIPFPAGAIVGWIALSAYLALYPATWVCLCWKLFPIYQRRAGRASGVPTESSGAKLFSGETPAVAAGTAAPLPAGPGSLSEAVTRKVSGRSEERPGANQNWWPALGDFFTTTNWWRRSAWAVLCGALWVALEMVLARFLSGFPWNLLGVSQHRMVPLIQVASVAGVYGVSFLVVWFSVSLVIALLRVIRQPGLRWGWLLELRLALVALIAVMVFGLGRMLERTDADRELRVALVQPSIPQLLIWDHSEDANRFHKIMELSSLALAAKPDLLIWPESSTPNFTEDNFQAITNLVATNKVWMILGADDAERRPGATKGDDYNYFNAAFLFSPEGKYVATYRKQHLVVFGEYLPCARRFPFLRRIIPIPGDFTPGERPAPFELTAPRARISTLICFEDVIPGLARQSARDDIDLLLNLTNDGWFGKSAAQWQQAANAVFRAVENGLPLLRCTNNGLTCWIDARGRMRDILQSESGDVYESGFLIVRIPLPPAGKRGEPTFYQRHGDWFGWGCVGLAMFALALSVRKTRRAARIF